MRRLMVTGLAAALIGGLMVVPAHAGTGMRSTLQRHVDALLKYGAPGVLAELDTRHGDLKVRSGCRNPCHRDHPR